VETVLGHSVIGGNEQPVFLGVLVAALAFEAIWCLTHGTNAIGPISHPANPTVEAELGHGVIGGNACNPADPVGESTLRCSDGIHNTT
jgi:hypothetical protein